MSLINKFEKHRMVITAKRREYTNVQFGSPATSVNSRNFMHFMEGLVRDKVISETWSRRPNPNGTFNWENALEQDGIILETSKHPLVNNGNAGTVIITGSARKLALFHRLMELHNVTYEGATKPEDVKLKYQYHSELNPALWEDEDKLAGDVLSQLTTIAKEFIKSLKMPKMKVEDIVMTGSSANYNWTQQSDIDLHILVDYAEEKKRYGLIIDDYFFARKKIWNDDRDVKIKGFPVELYVEDMANPPVAGGVYSIKRDEWIIRPKHQPPSIDDRAVKAKVAALMNEIDDLVDNCIKAEDIEKFMEKLKNLRVSGLQSGGEYSTENLAFKQLRNDGYLEKLSQCKDKAYDRALSIEEEEWVY